MTLQEVIKLAKQLSSVNKLRLIQQLTPDIEQELEQKELQPKKSLWGLCQNLGKAPSAKEIDLSRSEEWDDLAREDI